MTGVSGYLRALKGLNRDVRLFMVSVLASGVCYMGLYFLLINTGYIFFGLLIWKWKLLKKWFPGLAATVVRKIKST